MVPSPLLNTTSSRSVPSLLSPCGKKRLAAPGGRKGAASNHTVSAAFVFVFVSLISKPAALVRRLQHSRGDTFFRFPYGGLFSAAGSVHGASEFVRVIRACIPRPYHFLGQRRCRQPSPACSDCGGKPARAWPHSTPAAAEDAFAAPGAGLPGRAACCQSHGILLGHDRSRQPALGSECSLPCVGCHHPGGPKLLLAPQVCPRLVRAWLSPPARCWAAEQTKCRCMAGDRPAPACAVASRGGCFEGPACPCTAPASPGAYTVPHAHLYCRVVITQGFRLLLYLFPSFRDPGVRTASAASLLAYRHAAGCRHCSRVAVAGRSCWCMGYRYYTEEVPSWRHLQAVCPDLCCDALHGIPSMPRHACRYRRP